MTIIVIDDHPLMRDALVSVLRRLQPDENIVELDCMGKLKGAIEQFGIPKLFCVDLTLPDASGSSAIVSVSSMYPNVPIAVYSASPAADMEERCLQAGAYVYIEKSATATDLVTALREILMIENDPSAEGAKLSKRQKQLIGMIDKGMSNRDMAANLEISEHTVKVHLWRLFRRLGVKSRTQAIHHVRSHGLMSGFV